mgnify:FL=1
MSDETTRLKSAICAIHNHLHAGRVNEAHAACECAMTGAPVSQPNLVLSDSAKAAVFGDRFNRLCQELGVNAAFVALYPSATVKGYTSVQIGGSVEACHYVEAAFQTKSVYQGEHKS